MKAGINQTWQDIRFKLSAANSPIFQAYYHFLYKPKKNSLPAFLDKYSRHIGQLKVVQIGANDGITHDLIHKFIKRDKWHGILLEPQKQVFKRLQELYRKEEGIRPVNAAIGRKDGRTSLYKIGFSTARWATGLASFNRAVIESAFQSGYVQRKATEEGIAVPDDPAKQIIEEEIEMISPGVLLSRFGWNTYNLLQIDTEGFDFEVIKIFMDNDHLPNAIIYENAHISDADQQSCQKILAEKGYISHHFGKDTLALKSSLVKIFFPEKGYKQ